MVASGRKVEVLSETLTCSRSEAAAINPSTVLSEGGKSSARQRKLTPVIPRKVLGREQW